MQQLSFTCENHLYDGLNPESFLQQMNLVGNGGFGEVFVCPIATKVYALKKMIVSSTNIKTIESIKEEIANLEKIRKITPKPSSIPCYFGYFCLKFQIFNDLFYCLIFEHFPMTLRQVITSHQSSHTYLPHAHAHTTKSRGRECPYMRTLTDTRKRGHSTL